MVAARPVNTDNSFMADTAWLQRDRFRTRSFLQIVFLGLVSLIDQVKQSHTIAGCLSGHDFLPVASARAVFETSN